MMRTSVAIALALTAALARAEVWVVEGRVVGISDGDTITVLARAKAQHKIRLAGIDAPEKGQAFGDQSKENLSRLVFDRTVQAQCHKRDRYGREVCKVMRGSTDVCLEQIKAGVAWWYHEYVEEQSAEDRANYAAAEGDARAMRRGLWKDAKPMPPWEWRRGRSTRESTGDKTSSRASKK